MNTTAKNVDNQNPRGQLITRFANKYGVDQKKLLDTLKATAFRVDGEISNEQMMALLVVADQYGLNPFTREIYAFPDSRRGIVPIVGIDGWSRIINENPQFDGMDFEFMDENKCTCRIYRKDRRHPVEVTEFMDECKRDTPPWGSHPRRMLRHKAVIQCARLAFGYAGIYDEDEAERIIEAESSVIESQAVPIEPKATAQPLPDIRPCNSMQIGILRKMIEQSVANFGPGEDETCKHLNIMRLDEMHMSHFQSAVEFLKPSCDSDARANTGISSETGKSPE